MADDPATTPPEQTENLTSKGPARPEHAEDLLLLPVTDNPLLQGAKCDPRWAEQHCLTNRFYVSGVEWFFNLTGMAVADLVAYKSAAAVAARKAGWPKMNGASNSIVKRARGQWGAIAMQQFFNVSKSRAVQFPKAALFILACELALQALVEARDKAKEDGEELEEDAVEIPEDITSGLAVYEHLRIVPACWNINEFNQAYMQSQISSDPNFLTKLTTSMRPFQSTQVLEDLTLGHTVTYETARQVKDFDSKLQQPKLHNVRASRGRILGSKGAAAGEAIVNLLDVSDEESESSTAEE